MILISICNALNVNYVEGVSPINFVSQEFVELWNAANGGPGPAAKVWMIEWVPLPHTIISGAFYDQNIPDKNLPKLHTLTLVQRKTRLFNAAEPHEAPFQGDTPHEYFTLSAENQEPDHMKCGQVRFNNLTT